jgi:hypothetical protein
MCKAHLLQDYAFATTIPMHTCCVPQTLAVVVAFPFALASVCICLMQLECLWERPKEGFVGEVGSAIGRCRRRGFVFQAAGGGGRGSCAMCGEIVRRARVWKWSRRILRATKVHAGDVEDVVGGTLDLPHVGAEAPAPLLRAQRVHRRDRCPIHAPLVTLVGVELSADF